MSVFERLEEIFHSIITPDTDVENAVGAEELLSKKNIKLGLKSVSKQEAIEAAGKLLVENGYVGKNYIKCMLEREDEISTCVGKGIAIPHAENPKAVVNKSGIVILQYPKGIEWNHHEMVYLVIGIAGKDDEHLAILANIAHTLDEYSEEQMEILYNSISRDAIYKVFVENQQ